MNLDFPLVIAVLLSLNIFAMDDNASQKKVVEKQQQDCGSSLKKFLGTIGGKITAVFFWNEGDKDCLRVYKSCGSTCAVLLPTCAWLDSGIISLAYSTCKHIPCSKICCTMPRELLWIIPTSLSAPICLCATCACLYCLAKKSGCSSFVEAFEYEHECSDGGKSCFEGCCSLNCGKEITEPN